MDRGEFILKLSAEGRAWASVLHVPALVGLVFWHVPQPKWVQRFMTWIRKPSNGG